MSNWKPWLGNLVELWLCKLLGCRSIFSRMGAAWPHRYVCSPFVTWRR